MTSMHQYNEGRNTSINSQRYVLSPPTFTICIHPRTDCDLLFFSGVVHIAAWFNIENVNESVKVWWL